MIKKKQQKQQNITKGTTNTVSEYRYCWSVNPECSKQAFSAKVDVVGLATRPGEEIPRHPPTTYTQVPLKLI